MKKFTCLFMLCMAVGLTGCQEDEVSDNEGMEVQAELGVETGGETMATEAPGEEQPAVEESEIDIEAMKVEADPIVAHMSDWTAKTLMGYFEMPDSLTDVACAEVVGTAYYYTGMDTEYVPYEANDSFMYVPAEVVTQISMDIFGHSLLFDGMPTEEQISDNMVSADAQGGLIVMGGDWGLAAPVYEITDAEEMDNGNILVTVQYSMYDYEMDEISYELGNVSYELIPTHDSAYDFFVMNLTFNSTDYMDSLSVTMGEGNIFESALGYSIMLPAVWDGMVAINSTETQDTFIAVNCEEENYTGNLFYITIVNGTEADIVFPSYTILATEGDTMYVAYYPTDVQFDESMQDEYQSLQNQIPAVLDTFTIE